MKHNPMNWSSLDGNRHLQGRIFWILKRKPGICVEELALLLDLPVPQLQDQLRRCEEDGLVFQGGNGDTCPTGYRLTLQGLRETGRPFVEDPSLMDGLCDEEKILLFGMFQQLREVRQTRRASNAVEFWDDGIWECNDSASGDVWERVAN